MRKRNGFGSEQKKEGICHVLSHGQDNMITIIAPSRYSVQKRRLANDIAFFLKHKKLDESLHINFIFVGSRKMKTIAQKYKKENIALPVLSFPYKHDASTLNLLGEVFLCYPQIVLLAAERNKRVYEMVMEMIKHGVQNLLA